MKFWKKIGALTMAAALSLSALTGCGGGGSTGGNNTAGGNSASGGDSAGGGSTTATSDVKIGYINLADTDVFCMSRRDAFKTAAEAEGWSVEFTDGNNDVQKQIDQARSFIAKNVNALIIVPCDAAGIVPAVQEANRAGVPIILFGNGAEGADGLEYTFIGSPHTESGYMEGEYFAEILPENASICYLAGTAGLDHAAMRRDGMKKAFADKGRDDITILDDQDGDYVKDEGMRITQAWIQKFGAGAGKVSFQGIVSANDQMALGAMEALKGANIACGADIANGQVAIAGVDGTAEALKAVKEGSMVQTVLQDAPGQGAAAVSVIQTYLTGGTPDPEVLVPYVSVTAENVDQYLN